MDIFVFNKSICVQLQGITFIHLQITNDTHPTSRKIYWFKNVILIQKNYIHSTNFCSRKRDRIIRSRKLDSFNKFLFFQEIYIHSTKPIQKNIFFQALEFPVPLVYLFNKSSSRTSSTKTCIQRTWPSRQGPETRVPERIMWFCWMNINFLNKHKFVEWIKFFWINIKFLNG